MNDEIIEEFKKAIDEIYEQGYIVGFGTNRDKWITVYAKVMLEVSKGEEFCDQLMFACDDDLPTNMNEVN